MEIDIGLTPAARRRQQVAPVRENGGLYSRFPSLAQQSSAAYRQAVRLADATDGPPGFGWRVFMIRLQQYARRRCCMAASERRQNGTEGGRRPGLRRGMHPEKSRQKGRHSDVSCVAAAAAISIYLLIKACSRRLHMIVPIRRLCNS